jgi:hypothetical protein
VRNCTPRRAVRRPVLFFGERIGTPSGCALLDTGFSGVGAFRVSCSFLSFLSFLLFYFPK